MIKQAAWLNYFCFYVLMIGILLLDQPLSTKVDHVHGLLLVYKGMKMSFEKVILVNAIRVDVIVNIILSLERSQSRSGQNGGKLGEEKVTSYVIAECWVKKVSIMRMWCSAQCGNLFKEIRQSYMCFRAYMLILVVSEMGHHLFRYWLGTWSVPSHLLNMSRHMLVIARGPKPTWKNLIHLWNIVSKSPSKSMKKIIVFSYCKVSKYM